MLKEKMLVPQLRFSEFEGEWKINKLGQIAKFLKGKGISKRDIINDGDNECIRYGELYTTYNEVIDSIASKTNVALDVSVLSMKMMLLFLHLEKLN
jgi:type I restriction enzyme S subunit